MNKSKIILLFILLFWDGSLVTKGNALSGLLLNKVLFHTTVVNEIGSKMFSCFLALQSLLSPQAQVLSSSPHSQDSVEWSNISVG